MFAADFEVAQLDRRRVVRAPVSLDAAIGRGGLGRALCKVVDLSTHGARLQTYSALRKGQVIWLTLPELGHHAADVVWADDYVAGCQFREPLDPDAVAALVSRA